jgi:hypothetical protein
MSMFPFWLTLELKSNGRVESNLLENVNEQVTINGLVRCVGLASRAAAAGSGENATKIMG